MSGAATMVGRYFAGRDLDGRHRTNNRWARTGTELVDARHAGRWAHYSYRRRAGVRTTALVAAALLVYGAATDLVSTATTVRTAVWVLLGIAVWVAIHRTRRWSHRRQYVEPLALALAAKLGISSSDPTAWVRVPLDHLTNPDHPATVRLPADYTANETQRKQLARLAASKLGHGAAHDWTIDMSAVPPLMSVWAQPAPPSIVRIDRCREHLERASSDEPFIGLASRGRPVAVSWAQDSPSVLVSFGSGGGKSTVGRLLGAQALHKGTRVIIVDSVKRGASHLWAKDLSGVEIHRTPASAHDALIALADLVQQRCEISWDGGAEDFQRILLILEESNATSAQLQAYWQNELDGKKKSPAVQAIADILCVGRQAKTNVVAVGQQMTAQASGGGAARENYGVRMLSRFTRNTARMLVPECDPLPRSSRHPGRAQIVVEGVATETQIAYLTDDEAVEWATSGARHEPVAPVTIPALFPSARPGKGHLELIAGGPPGREPVGLREAVELGFVTCSLAVLRRQRNTAGSQFPASVGTRKDELLYDPAELTHWDRNRPQARSGA